MPRNKYFDHNAKASAQAKVGADGNLPFMSYRKDDCVLLLPVTGKLVQRLNTSSYLRSPRDGSSLQAAMPSLACSFWPRLPKSCSLRNKLSLLGPERLILCPLVTELGRTLPGGQTRQRYELQPDGKAGFGESGGH